MGDSGVGQKKAMISGLHDIPDIKKYIRLPLMEFRARLIGPQHRPSDLCEHCDIPGCGRARIPQLDMVAGRERVEAKVPPRDGYS